jgi:hypothetical protein
LELSWKSSNKQNFHSTVPNDMAFMVRSPSTTLGPATNTGSSVPEALFRKIALSDGRDTVHAPVWPGDEANDEAMGTRVIPMLSSSSSVTSSEEEDGAVVVSFVCLFVVSS